MGILFKAHPSRWLGSLIYFEQSFCISCFYEVHSVLCMQIVPPSYQDTLKSFLQYDFEERFD